MEVLLESKPLRWIKTKLICSDFSSNHWSFLRSDRYAVKCVKVHFASNAFWLLLYQQWRHFSHVQPSQLDILTLAISGILCSLSYTNCLSGVIIVFKANSWKPFSRSLSLRFGIHIEHSIFYGLQLIQVACICLYVLNCAINKHLSLLFNDCCPFKSSQEQV